MFVGSRQDVDAGLIGMAPGLVDPKKIVGLPKATRTEAPSPPLGLVPKTLGNVFRGDKHRQGNHAGPTVWPSHCGLCVMLSVRTIFRPS